MESSQDQYGLYLRLLLFVATVTACIAQISSSMELLNELSCHPPASMASNAKSNFSHTSQCVNCGASNCEKAH